MVARIADAVLEGRAMRVKAAEDLASESMEVAASPEDQDQVESQLEALREA
jgi:hypothetical protein